MGNLNDLAGWLTAEKGLDGANRPMRLRLAHLDRDVNGILLIQKIVGGEAICGGIDYELSCVATEAGLPLQEFIGLPAAVDLVTDRGELRSICGIVTEASAGDSDGGVACYKLRMRDAMAIMDMHISTRIFQKMNEAEIVEQIVNEWRQANAVLANAFEFEFAPLFNRIEYPRREFTLQYNESSAAFMRRLLRRRGISWAFRPGRARATGVDAASDTWPAHTLVVFNEACLPEQNAAGSVRYHRDGPTEERDTITSWGTVASLRPGRAALFSWDYKNPLGRHFMAVDVPGTVSQGANGDEIAASLGDYRIVAPHAAADYDDLCQLGHLRIARLDYETRSFHAECGVRDFVPWQYFTLTEHPEIDQMPAEERDFVITAFSITAQNNLPKSLAARVEQLFARSWRRADGPSAASAGANVNASTNADADDVGDGAVRCRIRVDVVRRDVAIVPAFDAHADVPHPPMQTVIVTGPPNEEVYCDALGRVKVTFPGVRAQDHAFANGAGALGTGVDSAWVRVASTWAGNGPGSTRQCGFNGLPRVGTEALVAFLDGDPDKPILVGQVYNGSAGVPDLAARGGLPDNRYLSGIQSREINGGRNNRLRFDDSTARINAQLASDHAASQLNLGFLVHPLQNGRGEARGDGAELRSDAAVAVRGAKGVLISAAASPGAAGTQLERDGLVGVAEILVSVAGQLATFATLHSKDAAAGEDLSQLLAKLKQWSAPGSDGGAPIVAASAPAGIVIASEANLMMGALSKVDLLSAGDTDIAAGKVLALRGARGISMFAHRDGMKLIAATGDVRTEAQHGNINLSASGEITLTAGVRITLSAPDIRLVAKGVQIDYGGDAITQQSKGKHLIKAPSYVYSKGGAGAPAELTFPESKLETDERFVMQHDATGEPISNRRYELTLEDGRIIRGITNAFGQTSLATSNAFGKVDICIFPEDGTA